MKRKRTGGKPGGFMAAVWLMLTACCWLTPCSGMDALTQSELDELSGQVGISIGFVDSGTNAVSLMHKFESICLGDRDGWGVGLNYTRGWLALIGDGSNTGQLGFVIPAGAKGTIDVGHTTAICYPMSQATHPGFFIPADKPFFMFSLTDVGIFLDDPTTVYICLTNNPLGTNRANMDETGWIRERGLEINLNPLHNVTPKCYIWAH